MSQTTRATAALRRTGIAFEVLSYAYDASAARVGLQAATALGESPERVLKTLMAAVDGKPVCAIVPSDREMSMKKLAAAAKGKAAQMLSVPDAERLTGYHVGGVSPFGQRRKHPVFLEESALVHVYVLVNGGQRGLQLKLAPADLQRTLDAIVAPLIT